MIPIIMFYPTMSETEKTAAFNPIQVGKKYLGNLTGRTLREAKAEIPALQEHLKRVKAKSGSIPHQKGIRTEIRNLRKTLPELEQAMRSTRKYTAIGAGGLGLAGGGTALATSGREKEEY